MGRRERHRVGGDLERLDECGDARRQHAPRLCAVSRGALVRARAGAVTELRFRVSDPGRELAGVRLVSDGTKRHPPAFRRRGNRWELRLPPPPLARMEYELELEAL